MRWMILALALVGCGGSAARQDDLWALPAQMTIAIDGGSGQSIDSADVSCAPGDRFHVSANAKVTGLQAQAGIEVDWFSSAGLLLGSNTVRTTDQASTLISLDAAPAPAGCVTAGIGVFLADGIGSREADFDSIEAHKL